jgi:hypothetical protein
MKFLVTGALNRPGGPRGLILAALALFSTFEICTAVLVSLESAGPETLALALEEVHILIFFRGLEALFLASVLAGLPLDAIVKRIAPAALFGIPLAGALLVLVSPVLPELYAGARAASLLASSVFILASALTVRTMYAR